MRTMSLNLANNNKGTKHTWDEFVNFGINMENKVIDTFAQVHNLMSHLFLTVFEIPQNQDSYQWNTGDI